MPDPRLLQTVSAVLKIDAESVRLTTSQENTPTWDSMAHLLLILHIEEALGVRFHSDEIPDLTSVGSIQEALERLGVKG